MLYVIIVAHPVLCDFNLVNVLSQYWKQVAAFECFALYSVSLYKDTSYHKCRMKHNHKGQVQYYTVVNRKLHSLYYATKDHITMHTIFKKLKTAYLV